MGRFYGVLACCFLLISSEVWSQTRDCEQTIAYATDEFNAGHFYSVPEILKECLTTFSREQKQRAYLLLTQTYLLLDDPAGAERSYLEVLWANPEFVPNEQLHAIDIVYLSKRYTATPRFSWYFSAGSNISAPRVILDNDVAVDAREKYGVRAGYNFGVGGEYSYNDNLRLRVEANFFQTSYQLQAFDYFEADVKTLRDGQSWINIPLIFCYSDNRGSYRPYGYAGASISRLLHDKGSIALRKIEGEGDAMDIVEVQSPDFNFTNRRNALNPSVIFGAGVKYKLGLDYLFAEVRYSAGLKNIVNPDYLYGNSTLRDETSNTLTSSSWVLSASPATEYTHVDDFFRFDNLALTVGFLRPLYKPRELKRARTKSVLRKIRQSK